MCRLTVVTMYIIYHILLSCQCFYSYEVACAGYMVVAFNDERVLTEIASRRILALLR
jgi:hypothetical protein